MADDTFHSETALMAAHDEDPSRFDEVASSIITSSTYAVSENYQMMMMGEVKIKMRLL